MLIKSGGYPPTSAFDPATTAWVVAVVANGGTVSNSRKVLVDALIVGLRADNVFAKLDHLWLFAGENEPSALTDIVGLTLATAVGGPTFTADDGYTGGASKYIDTNIDPSTAGGHYTELAAHWSVWQYSSTPNPGSSIGGHVFQYVRATLPYSIDGHVQWRVNFGDTDEVSSGTFASSQGLWVGRTANAAVSSELYNNGALADTAGAHATGFAAAIIFLANSNSGADWYTDIVSAGGFGGDLTATDISNLYSRMRTYMTAVGVP